MWCHRATDPTTWTAVRFRLSIATCDQDFGAVGDGVSDDTEAVSAALQYAATCGANVEIGGSRQGFLVWPNALVLELRDVTVRLTSFLIGPPLLAWNPQLEEWPAGSCAYGHRGAGKRSGVGASELLKVAVYDVYMVFAIVQWLIRRLRVEAGKQRARPIIRRPPKSLVLSSGVKLRVYMYAHSKRLTSRAAPSSSRNGRRGHPQFVGRTTCQTHRYLSSGGDVELLSITYKDSGCCIVS